MTMKYFEYLRVDFLKLTLMKYQVYKTRFAKLFAFGFKGINVVSIVLVNKEAKVK